MGSRSVDEDRGRSGQLTRIAQVVPELATFAVDDGFSYAVPDSLDRITVGSIVRVPLGGRKVRGYVVDLRREVSSPRKLRDIQGISGDLPVFDGSHLETLRWAAVHYVAPVAALLPRAAPPNLPKLPVSQSEGSREGSRRPELESPLPDVTAAAAEGRRLPPQYLVRGQLDHEVLGGLLDGMLAAGRSGLVVMPTVAEAERLTAAVRNELGWPVSLATSALSARRVTEAWVVARTSAPTLTIGTREVAFWPVSDLGMVVVVEEGRRGMKAPQTPTTHVREILRRRAAVERFQLVFAGPVPTGEAVATGATMHEQPGRVWPLIEIADRNDDQPGSGVVGERVRQAVKVAGSGGRRVFVLVHRRGYAPAFRCVRCRTIRRCSVCGAGAGREPACPRCGTPHTTCSECGGGRFEPLGAGVGRVVDDLRRSLGDAVGSAEEGEGPVVVGTERDLPGVGEVDLAVAVDIDAVMLAPHYRAAEDALRLAARLAGKVRRGPGNRCLIQTAVPDHEAIVAARSGHPLPFLHAELRRREPDGFPPLGGLMAIEVRDAPSGADEALRGAVGEGVHGPAEVAGGERWLVQGRDLRPAKIRLRDLVQQWRDGGARVRVDADPIDL